QLAGDRIFWRKTIGDWPLNGAVGHHFTQRMVVILQEQGAVVRGKVIVKFTFGLLHTLEASEPFEVGLAHVRNETVCGFGNPTKESDFTHMVGAHLDDRDFCLRRYCKDG